MRSFKDVDVIKKQSEENAVFVRRCQAKAWQDLWIGGFMDGCGVGHGVLGVVVVVFGLISLD
jgi:hypothetical protein